jgi:hypothetical protein
MAKVKKKVGRKGFTKKEAAWGSHRGNITNKLMKERRQRLFIKAYIRTGIITKAASSQCAYTTRTSPPRHRR